MAARLLLLVAACAASLLLAEGVARVFAPGWQPTVAERGLFWHYHPILGWAHRPGTKARFTGPSWDVPVEINSRGLRDVEHPELPQPGRRRVLLLGDSFGWGFGVRREEGVAAVLQERCPRLEIVNASVSGYSTDQQYLYFREEGHRYQPAEVLLLFHENDLLGNSRRRMYGYEKPHFALHGDQLALENVPVPARRLWERLYAGLSARSYLANGILSAGALREQLEMDEPWVVEAGVTPRLLERFALELRRRGVAFRWILLPMRHSLVKQLMAQAGRLGVPALSLAGPFRRAAQQGLVTHLARDPHWNPAGHRLAAEAIAGALGCGR